VFVLPLVPYLQSLGLQRDELIQALGLSLLVSATALGVALAREGALPLATLGASVAALAPAGLGVAIGAGAKSVRRCSCVFSRSACF